MQLCISSLTEVTLQSDTPGSRSTWGDGQPFHTHTQALMSVLCIGVEDTATCPLCQIDSWYSPPLGPPSPLEGRGWTPGNYISQNPLPAGLRFRFPSEGHSSENWKAEGKHWPRFSLPQWWEDTLVWAGVRLCRHLWVSGEPPASGRWGVPAAVALELVVASHGGNFLMS